MVNIRDYFKSTTKLVNTLTIKIDAISKHFNYQYFIKNGMEVPIPEEDKYFLNLSGLRASIDPQVFVYDAVTESEIELTIDNVNKNIWLKKELSKFDTFFNTVCSSYPGMSVYIRGCVNQVSLNDVLELNSGSILSYDKTLIGDNELSLVYQIEDFISSFLSTYHNPNYMINELYLPALIFNLYQSITMFVIAKRMENVLTNKANEFHIDNHLSSYKDIYELTDIFKLETKIYLYGNISRLKTSIGKNKILNELLDKVYDRNTYGVGRVVFNKRKPDIKTDTTSYLQEFYTDNYDFDVIPANESAYNIVGGTYPLTSMLELEDVCELVHEDDLFDNDFNIQHKYKDHFLSTRLNKTKTKTFVLDKPEKIITRDTNIFVTAFSNLLELVINDTTIFYTDYINPIDNRLYKLSDKDVKNILIYNILEVYNVDLETVDITLSGLINKNINKDIVLNQTWHKQLNSKIYDYILGDINTVDMRSSDLNTYFKSIAEVEKRIWYIMSNVTDVMLKNDIRIIAKNIVHDMSLVANVAETRAYITNNGLENFTGFSAIENIINLLALITGLDIDPVKTVLNRFKKLVRFFDKTTSYTIHLVYDDTFKDTFITNNVSSNLNLTYKSLLEVKSATWEKYQQADYLIKSYNMNVDDVDIDTLSTRTTCAISKIGLLPCLSITDNVSRNELVFGSTKRRMRKHVSNTPNSKLYDDNTFVSMPNMFVFTDMQKVIPSYTELLGLDPIMTTNVLVSQGFNYNTNYTTRDGKVNYLLDNMEMNIVDDTSGYVKLSNNEEGLLLTSTETISTHDKVIYSKASMLRRMSTFDTVLRYIKDFDIESHTNVNNPSIMKLNALSTYKVNDSISNNGLVTTLAEKETVKKMTRIIEDIYTTYIANRDDIDMVSNGKDDYFVKSGERSKVKIKTDDLTGYGPTYMKMQYGVNLNPINDHTIKYVDDDRINTVNNASVDNISLIVKDELTAIYNSDELLSDTVTSSSNNLLKYGSFLSSVKSTVVFDKKLNTYKVSEIISSKVDRSSIVTTSENIDQHATIVSKTKGNIPYGNYIGFYKIRTMINDTKLDHVYEYNFDPTISYNRGIQVVSMETDIASKKIILADSDKTVNNTSLISYIKSTFSKDSYRMGITESINDVIDLTTNRELKLYTDIEDLNKLNYGYDVSAYMSNTITKDSNINNVVEDDGVELDLSYSPRVRSYDETTVSVELDEIELDLTFEIKTK